MTWTRPRDEYGRAFYAPNEVPPATEEFAHWLGKLTHPSAVVTNRGKYHKCTSGWVESGEWWLHCGVCRPELNDGCTHPRRGGIVDGSEYCIDCGAHLDYPELNDGSGVGAPGAKRAEPGGFAPGQPAAHSDGDEGA